MCGAVGTPRKDKWAKALLGPSLFLVSLRLKGLEKRVTLLKILELGSSTAWLLWKGSEYDKFN